ncbi:MAG: GDSL-type esterase/lipase family protein [Flavobacteriaceae bacterium]
MGRLFVFILTCIACNLTNAQGHLRFADEVTAIQKKYDTLWDASKETIVFTGSSSVRIWKDLQERFPMYHIVNSGFGGSQASDLLAYSEQLILHYRPKKVFIYEGDNDIAGGKKTREIVAQTDAVISRIVAQNPSAQIVLIAAKPSIARWNLKSKYKKLNRSFQKLARREEQIHFADVWKPMLDKRKVKQDIFLADGLHMNAKGYEIWYQVLKPFLEDF